MVPRPLPREDLLQCRRRNVANRISKTWKINRQSKRPRGFQNRAVDCYRIGALQPLLHLPRFVNWILQHNERRQNWPCGPNDENRVPEDDPITQEILAERAETLGAEEDGQPLFTGCVPCLLKLLILEYWGNTSIGPGDGNPPFQPLYFPFDHPATLRLHMLADRWFCVDPEGHYDFIHDGDNDFTYTEEEEYALTKQARIRNMQNQQDSDEFQQRLIARIKTATITYSKTLPPSLRA